MSARPRLFNATASSASWRVRIALALNGIGHDAVLVARDAGAAPPLLPADPHARAVARSIVEGLELVLRGVAGRWATLGAHPALAGTQLERVS